MKNLLHRIISFLTGKSHTASYPIISEYTVDETLTEVIFVIDRSGSMHLIKSEAVTGYNDSILAQSNIQNCNFSLIFFNDKPELICDGFPIDAIPLLSEKTYKPNGGTALHDAVIFAIEKVNKRLYGNKNVKIPNKVIMFILTDGDDNRSKHSISDMFQAIKRQCDNFKWEIQLFSAVPDILSRAEYEGMPNDNLHKFDVSNRVGVKEAFTTMTQIFVKHHQFYRVKDPRGINFRRM